MSLHNYSCLNTGEGTFIKHDGTRSYLDIAIISSNLSLGSDWYVHDDSLGSDHLPISVAINFSIHKEIPSQAHWNYRKANWEGFKVDCCKIMERVCCRSPRLVHGEKPTL